MPIFIYSAKSLTGEIKTGTQEAASEAELAHALREGGFILTSVRTAGQSALPKIQLLKFLPSFKHVPLTEKMIFCRHLGVMIGAGLSLNRALETLSQQTKNKSFAKIIQKLNEDVKKGQPLADALAKYPKVFSDLFVNMVKVGEASGNLEGVLKILTNQMEKENELLSKVKGAMIYPAVVLTATFGIGVLMMVMVVPRLLQVFQEVNMKLPLSTRVVIGISNFLSHYWPLVLAGLVLTVILVRLVWQFKRTKKIFDWLILHSLVIGEISKKINSARLARTLGSLIESGVPIVQGLQIVAGTMNNSLFRDSLANCALVVQKGKPLSEAIKDYPRLYPVIVDQMITVGEETGTLGEILGKLADFYENEVADLTKGLSSIIEPVMMIIIGTVVGFFAISMIQPMYSIMEGI